MNDIADQLIEEFLTANRKSGGYLHDRITRLAELSISHNRKLAEAASKVLFTKLVEPLADSFDPPAVSLYNRALAQVIQVCREDTQAADLDRELNAFGLTSEEALVSRVEKLRTSYQSIKLTDSRLPIKRVIVLSRVTIGADIAVTSLVMERMKREFPSAELVLVGGAKAIELFRGDSRVHFKEISYSRSGTTIERLCAWMELLSCVRSLTAGLDRREYLIVDPDTRLTQLGLLPLERVDADTTHHLQNNQRVGPSLEPYLFFPSREYGSDTSYSLGELTSRWLDDIFAANVRTYPNVNLSVEDIESGRKLVKLVRRDAHPVVAINFGVGGNSKKRINDDFEAELVTRLIQNGASIIFDKGAGEDERRRADAVIDRVTQLEYEGRRVRAIEYDEQRLNIGTSVDEDSEILVWNGRIGILAALIGESDLYVGYDSAGQHIAAALGIKCIDVFAGFSSQRFVDRWRPDGRAETRVIAVDAKTTNPVEQILAYIHEML
jgi:ADP-heptose:LPS heptosyltransferase